MANIIRPIEPFELTQVFGVNEPLYRRFGLKGHNGWDLRTKFPDTPKGFRHILASWKSKFYSQGNEGNDGFGKFLEVTVQLFNLYKLTYAHCLSIETFTNKNEGESMAISDNTGNSTASHLHLSVKKGSLKEGKFQVDNYNNGFFGAIEPQVFFDELRAFKNINPNLPSPPPKPPSSVVGHPNNHPIMKEQVIIDLYLALTGAFPSDDEKKWRLDSNKNTVQIAEDICGGDSRFYDRWVKPKIPAVNPEGEKAIKELDRVKQDLSELVSSIRS